MADLRLLALTHLLAAGAGYMAAPRELLADEVTQSGFFQVDTKRVLAAAVESLRSENKLLVYSFKGLAAVSVERDSFLIFDGSQSLTISGTVSLLVDLTKLGPTDVIYDDRTKVVTVGLPPLVMNDIAWDLESARSENGGLLTFSQGHVDELTKMNLARAKAALTKQAQGAELVQAAKAQAIKAVESAFEIPLRAAGLANVQVVAVF